ncbi:unnamed protein product [Acanthosepion pharaonis]|uniref:Uncharacterized protein n=1 Tax=Acanthosepion pharaonis TaxID=158019 RepID=A0A812DH26_ACAPH|nr:unnamed protein product [Sepia pharaonis]
MFWGDLAVRGRPGFFFFTSPVSLKLSFLAFFFSFSISCLLSLFHLDIVAFRTRCQTGPSIPLRDEFSSQIHLFGPYAETSLFLLPLFLFLSSRGLADDQVENAFPLSFVSIFSSSLSFSHKYLLLRSFLAFFFSFSISCLLSLFHLDIAAFRTHCQTGPSIPLRDEFSLQIHLFGPYAETSFAPGQILRTRLFSPHAKTSFAPGQIS